MATIGGRTRHSHAVLDGVSVDNDKKFGNGCRFPGDPQGPACEVYNCRCCLIADFDGADTSHALRRDRYEIVTNQTYAQWEASKRGEGYLQKKSLTLPRKDAILQSFIMLDDIPVGMSLGAKRKSDNIMDLATGFKYDLADGTYITNVCVLPGKVLS